MRSFVAVLTTIQEPTFSVSTLVQSLKRSDIPLVVIGDKKGPARFEMKGADFFSLEQQIHLDYQLAKALPVGHYTRKNLGYLLACEMGAACIYETDDDNAPLPSWGPRSEHVRVKNVRSAPWVNAYRFFSETNIWPRGFPLERLKDLEVCGQEFVDGPELVRAPIQQGLANGAPDVDAVWRLVLDRPVVFDAGPAVRLPEFTYCPFNSQSTWWWPDAYILMYLPSFCSFRMTDIWRSLIAQRCLWEMGCGVVFHGAEVLQERNAHNLIQDFRDEVQGYLENDRIAAILTRCKLMPGSANTGLNLAFCYEALIEEKIFPQDEMPLVRMWLSDIEKACGEKELAIKQAL